VSRLGGASLLVSAGIYVACSSFDEQQGAPQDDAQAPDSAQPDGAPTEADADGGALDAALPDIALAENWSTFNLLKAGAAPGSAYQGGVFDGKNVYLVPSGGRALRFDATLPFTDAASWKSFDLEAASGSARFIGGTFDGRYVYYTPNGAGAPVNARAARFDTQGQFDDAGSWRTFLLSSLYDAGAGGVAGAYYDGENVVYTGISLANDGGADAGFSRAVYPEHRAGGTFSDAGSWTAIEGASLTVPIKRSSWSSVAFDGTYAYQPNPFAGDLLRLKLPGTAEVFDLKAVNAPDTLGYLGAVFDGRYVYLAPVFRVFGTSLVTHGVAMRYDTTKTFSDAASYQKFNLESVTPEAKGFNGAVFDGRFVYFAPALSSRVVRFDTTRAFIDGTAWSYFDVSSIAPASSFCGAVFDGQYVYFVPLSGGLVVRFKARNDRIQPKTPASFY
jgi:hypothetical protein